MTLSCEPLFCNSLLRTKSKHKTTTIKSKQYHKPMATKDVEMSHEPAPAAAVAEGKAQTTTSDGPLVTVDNVELTASTSFSEAMGVKLAATFSELVEVEFEMVFSPNGLTHEQTLLKRLLKAERRGRCEFAFEVGLHMMISASDFCFAQIPAPALYLPDGKCAIPPEDLPSDANNNYETAGLVMSFSYKSKVEAFRFLLVCSRRSTSSYMNQAFCVVGYLLELTRGSAGLERRLSRTQDGNSVHQEVTLKPINWHAATAVEEKADEKAAEEERYARDAALKLFVGLPVVAPGTCAKELTAMLLAGDQGDEDGDEDGGDDDFVVDA